MTTLVEFLRARLDEDEAVARAAEAEWKTEHTRYHLAGLDDEPAGHIARHDPARVLADVAAKRQIVDHAEHWQETLYATPEGWTAVAATAYRMAMQWTLELMATSWADHPDYDQSWRP